MKKLITIMLAVALVLSFAVTAYAATATINTADGSASQDVMAQYVSDITTVSLYSVDVEWGALEFTYEESATKTWNPETHQYDVSNEASEWTANGNTVKVTNHSDNKVTATPSFKAETGFNVTGIFDVASKELASAVGTQVANAPSQTFTLTLAGKLAETVTTLTKVGTVTVTLS